jgi:hypothetical protein
MAERSREATVAERLPVRPESLDFFRLGRLLVLLSTASEAKAARPLDLERLGYYDFFAANPFLVFGGEDERRELVLAGFDSRNLSYQSSAQRSTNRRARLQYDLALLVAYGLVRPEVVANRVAYSLTDHGAEFAGPLRVALRAFVLQERADDRHAVHLDSAPVRFPEA